VRLPALAHVLLPAADGSAESGDAVKANKPAPRNPNKGHRKQLTLRTERLIPLEARMLESVVGGKKAPDCTFSIWG
jgi:hypothetical protein